MLRVVKPLRDENRDQQRRRNWWRLGRSGGDLREAIRPLQRCIVTPRVSKYRLFVWETSKVLPDSAVVVIARDDDTTFGILHSRFHEAWSLRLGTWLGVGNDPRYTPTTTFQTFPLPEGLTPNIPASAYCRRPSRETHCEGGGAARRAAAQTGSIRLISSRSSPRWSPATRTAFCPKTRRRRLC